MNSCSFNVEGSEGSCRTIAKHLFCLGQKLFFVRYFRERSRPMRRPAIEDRRIQKTLSLLRDALVSLIVEKPYDTIVVKEILDRANVGRSTFYTHFRDKDDLLVSGIHDMLGEVPSPIRTGGRNLDRILWFSLPIFEHHYSHAHAWGDRIGTKGRTILHEHLRRVLTGIVAEVVKKDYRAGRQSPREMP